MNTYLLNSHNPLNVHLIDHEGIDEQVTGRLEFSSEPQHLAKCHDMSANEGHSRACQLLSPSGALKEG